MRSLINLCYFTYILKNTSKAIELNFVMERVAKLVVILIGEITQIKESKENAQTVSLLTILMLNLHMTIKPSAGT